MPIFVDSPDFSATLLGGKASSGFQQGSSGSITIGLINNMPDEALKATERQFLSLLRSASDGMQVRLLHYMLPDVPRQEPARGRCYSLGRLPRSRTRGERPFRGYEACLDPQQPLVTK
jgi:Homoserine O-succinyltransferase